jgi:hypothetical protein
MLQLPSPSLPSPTPSVFLALDSVCKKKENPKKTSRNNQCGVGILIFVITASSGFFFFFFNSESKSCCSQVFEKIHVQRTAGCTCVWPQKNQNKRGALHTLKEPPGFVKELTNTGQFSRQFI